MACLGPSTTALRAHAGSAVAARAIASRPAGSGGAAGWRQAVATARSIGGGRASNGRLSSRLQPPPTTLAIVPQAAASGGVAVAARRRGGRPITPVPDVDAEQLLRSLGLDGTADPTTLLTNVRKLRNGVRQQGVLDHAAAVAAHLLSPDVGLTQRQAGQLLERCPELFSRPPAQRAAVLFSQLMAAGLTAAEAAQCVIAYSPVCGVTSLEAGLAELAAILAHSQDRQGSSPGPATPPASQRSVAVLLRSRPAAVQLVCNRAGYLQRRAAELQQAGYSAAGVAAVAWEQPPMLCTPAAARVPDTMAAVQQELGLTAAQLDSLSARRKRRWLTDSSETVRARAAALAEAFGKEAVAEAVMTQSDVLSCSPALWRRNLCLIAACGVADPKAVLLQRPELFSYDHAAPEFLQRRLLLQRTFRLTAKQLYARPHCLLSLQPGQLAQRLRFVEQRGQAHRLVAKATGKRATAGKEEWQPALTILTVTRKKFLPALGVSEAEWEAWVVANPPEACPLYRWAQQAAAEEAVRLAAALPPELQPAAEAEEAAVDGSSEAEVLG